jgi:hypothetical protein
VFKGWLARRWLYWATEMKRWTIVTIGSEADTYLLLKMYAATQGKHGHGHEAVFGSNAGGWT